MSVLGHLPSVCVQSVTSNLSSWDCKMQAHTYHSLIPSYLQPTFVRFTAFRSLPPCTSDLPLFLFGNLSDSVFILFYIPCRISLHPLQNSDIYSQVSPYANRQWGQTSDTRGPGQFPSLSRFPRMLKRLAVCSLGWRSRPTLPGQENSMLWFLNMGFV